MNHYAALQVDPASDRPDAGKWRYCCSNRRTGIYPVGYCSDLRDCPTCHGFNAVPQSDGSVERVCDTCDGKGYVEVEPCPGHDTPEGAYAHQTEYLLNEELRLSQDQSAQHRCQVCGEWTQGYAMVGDAFMAFLCDEHRTREHVAELYHGAGESWSSY